MCHLLTAQCTGNHRRFVTSHFCDKSLMSQSVDDVSKQIVTNRPYILVYRFFSVTIATCDKSSVTYLMSQVNYDSKQKGGDMHCSNKHESSYISDTTRLQNRNNYKYIVLFLMYWKQINYCRLCMPYSPVVIVWSLDSLETCTSKLSHYIYCKLPHRHRRRTPRPVSE